MTHPARTHEPNDPADVGPLRPGRIVSQPEGSPHLRNKFERFFWWVGRHPRNLGIGGRQLVSKKRGSCISKPISGVQARPPLAQPLRDQLGTPPLVPAI